MSIQTPQLPGDYAAYLSAFNSNKFKVLWPAQEHVLSRYGEHAQQTDLGIELPTGAGKTLIALLIAEAWRAKNAKVPILSANKALARQMLSEAQVLGVPAVLMQGKGSEIAGADKRAYQRAQKVGIMNYWVYFNQNPYIDPADLLIMDDAHLAEHCLHSLFSVEINRYEHDELFRSLVTELRERFPEYSVLTDALSNSDPQPSTPPQLLSFFDQSVVVERLRQIVDASPTLAKDLDLNFRWGRLRNSLLEANIYLGLNSIWVRPYIYPLLSFSHYTESTQRLYVSATIGDPADLSRRLGVKPIAKIPVDAKFGEKTSGRRLVVMNRIDESDVPKRLGSAIVSALSVHPKSVWLCASHAEATKYRTAITSWLNSAGFVGHPTWTLSSLGDEIDDFKKSPTGHLFVAGRFDGMDFKADECRLVVMTTLPRAIDLQEEFICDCIHDSGFMRRRLNQRVIQALGRCNRGDEDFGVYILVDRRFATHFGRESNREGIPRNMAAEIDMAQDNADLTDDALAGKVKTFLSGDFSNYDADLGAYYDAVPQVPTSIGPVSGSDTVQAEVTAWAALFGSHNYQIAADKFEEAWSAYKKGNVIEMGAFQKWNWAKSVNLQSAQDEPLAKQRSLELADEAITRGGQASWFNRLRTSVNRAKATTSSAVSAVTGSYAAGLVRSMDDLFEKFGTKDRLEKFCKSISDGLACDKHQQYAAALENLGTLLGFHAARPKGKAATDTRWRGTFGDVREVVTLEVKIEHTDGTAITPTHVGQAHIQLNRAVSEFVPLGYGVRGTIVTHLSEIEAAAKSSTGPLRVIRKKSILALWERTQLLLWSYREKWSVDDVAVRLPAAEALYTKCPEAGWLFRALDSDVLFIEGSHLLKEWPGAGKDQEPSTKPCI